MKAQVLIRKKSKLTAKPKAKVVLATPIESTGAKELREESGVLRVAPERAGIVRASLVINWGNTQLALRPDQRVYNAPHSVQVAVNKLSSLLALREAKVPTLEFDTSYERLAALYPTKRILARTVLNGSSGVGIEIIEPGTNPAAVPNAPLYTVYFPKVMELRVHVWGMEAILVQQKIRRNGMDAEERSVLQKVVRNVDNGWVFTTNLRLDPVVSNERLDKIKAEAVSAVNNMGLDFGAVDMLISTTKSVVCEVNTRPGIASDPVRLAYAAKLKELL